MEPIGQMEDEDNMQLLSYRTKFCLAVSGMLLFPLLHQLVGLLIHRCCSSLEQGVIFRISTRIVSGIQALIVVTISARNLILCKDIMKDEDPYTHAYIWFGVSYFPYDIVMMYIGYTYQESCQKHHSSHSRSFMRFFKRETVMVLHHIIFLTIGLPISEVYKKRLGDFFLSCFFLAEGSTPFYSINGIFKEIGIKDGYLYAMNGLLFTVSFFVCRILSVPYMFLRYAYFSEMPFFTVPFIIPYKCTIACLAFFALQLYWFLLICSRFKMHFVTKIVKYA